MNINSAVDRNFTQRMALFTAFCGMGFAACADALHTLLSSDSDLYSHVPAIYCISAFLVFKERRKVFEKTSYCFLPGILVLCAGAAINISGRIYASGLSHNDYLFIMSLSFALCVAGSFLFCFGKSAFSESIFPICLLLMAVAIPDLILGRVIAWLQVMSFSAAAWLLDFFRLYPIRHGFVLTLPGISVEVAEQCSGIRSSIALLIVSMLYSYYFMRTYAGKTLLITISLFIIPFKNGLRIATLILLALYWDKAILAGPMHKFGGIPFFGVGLVWVSLVMILLAYVERRFLRLLESRSGDKLGD